MPRPVELFQRVEGSLMHQTSRSNPPAMPVPSPADNNFSLNKIWMKTKEEKATTSHLGPGGGWARWDVASRTPRYFRPPRFCFGRYRK